MPQAGPNGGEPGKPRAAKRVNAQKRKVIRKASHTAQIPGVSGAAQPKLAKHREKARAQREQHIPRQPKAPVKTQVPGVAAVVSPHLARHRANRERQEQAAAKGREQASLATGLPPLAAKPPKPGHVAKVATQAKVNKPSNPIDDVIKTVEGGAKAAKDLFLGTAVSTPGQKALEGPTTPTGQARAVKEDLPKATAAAIKTLKLNRGPSPAEQLTGGVSGVPGGAQIARNVGKNLVQLPQQSVTTGYEAGKAAVEAAQGKPQRAEKLAKGLTEGFVGNLVKGKPDKALKYAEQNPVFAGLEVAGVYSGLGRAAGAVTRSSVSPKVVRRATSTAREPRKISATQVRTRHYSKNLITQAGQRILDRKDIGPTEVKGLRVPARAARNAVREERNKLARNQAVDVASDTSQMIGRQARGSVKRKMIRSKPVRKHPAPAPEVGIKRVAPKRVVKKVTNVVERSVAKRPEQELVDLVAEGRLRPKTFKQDLQKIHDRLVSESASLEGKAAKDNAQQVAHIQAVMKDPKALANVKGIVESARVYQRHANEITRKEVEQGIRTPDQAERRRLLPYAVEHMAAKEEGGRFVTSQGQTLPTSAIKSHMREHGVNPNEVAYISRAPRKESAAFYQPLVRGRGGTSKKFKGGSVVKGTGPSGFRALTTEAVRQRGEVNRVDLWDRFMDRVALKGNDGKPHVTTHGNAERLAERINAATGEDYVPVRRFAAQHQGQAGLDLQDVVRHPSDIIQRASAKPLPHEKTAPIWGLAPRQQLSRLQKLEGVGSSTAGKAGNVITHQFVRTVLPLSVKWFFGNDFEAALRLAVRGVAPHDPLIGRKILHAALQVDSRTGQELDAIARNAGFYGSSAKRMGVRRTSEDFADSMLDRPARAIEAVRDAPVLRKAFDGIGMMIDGVMALNTKIENTASLAALGKFGRGEIQELNDSWLKSLRAQDSAVRDMVERRMVDPAKLEEVGHYIDETLGKYRRFGPEAQRFIQTYAPFLPWWMNSVRFVYWTLPVHHPLLTALLTKTEATLQDEYERQHKAAPPGDLKSAIQLGPEKYLNLAHFTPFGAFTAKTGGLENVSDILTPQVSGILSAARGQTFFGKEIRNLDDSTRALLVLNAFVTSYVPGASLAKTIMEGGHSAADTSTIFAPEGKPGSHVQSPAERILNPLRPTYVGGKNKAQQKGAGIFGGSTKKPDTIFGGSKQKKSETIFGP